MPVFVLQGDVLLRMPLSEFTKVINGGAEVDFTILDVASFAVKIGIGDTEEVHLLGQELRHWLAGDLRQPTSTATTPGGPE